jgi:hypothetical protein
MVHLWQTVAQLQRVSLAPSSQTAMLGQAQARLPYTVNGIAALPTAHAIMLQNS